ncbi:hypothetical protein GCM10009087_50910 [Sphingomonas oligophenolica]
MEYYHRIDALDIDWVMALFCDDACYRRAGAVYDGKAAIERFFREERKINGSHDIATIVDDGDQRLVVICGRFTGEGEAGDRRAVEFADFWTFDDAAKVRLRRGYLAVGHELVAR